MIDTRKRTVSFLTLGCPKNEVDTAHMAARLNEAGYSVLDWDEANALLENNADTSRPSIDAVIVNTCSFLREAIEESLDVIFDIAGTAAILDGHTKLIVVGCLPSRYGADLQSELTEANAFIPCADEHTIVEVLDRQLGIDRSDDAKQSIALTDPCKIRLNASPSAYVKISDGCNRFCSFCAIPSIRGHYHSFTYDQINAEVANLVAQGVKEIVLIAQDTGIWGTDLEPAQTLAELISMLAEAFPNIWFRVMYVQPEYINDDLLDVIASHDNVCNYLDIPFQHVDPQLLRSMNRKGSRQEFETLVERIRNKIPDVALRTTLIVGYPGETDDMFDELCDFVAQADLDYVGVFAFSPEEGTKAATLPGQLEEEIKQERSRTLREIADAVSTSQLKRFIGQCLDVLVLGNEEDGQLIGRSKYQAPDVDGVTYIDSGIVGSIIPIIIEDTLYYEMEGTRECSCLNQ